MNTNYMEFLCWVDRCMFPADLADDLEELGLDKMTAAYYNSEWCMQNKTDYKFNIVRLYQNYCLTNTDEGTVGYYIIKWLDIQFTKWEGYKKK